MPRSAVVPPPLSMERDPEAVPRALARWLPPEGPLTHLLEAAGYQRNIVRAAEAWGPRLIARLVEHGYLEAEGAPEEALLEALEGAGE